MELIWKGRCAQKQAQKRLSSLRGQRGALLGALLGEALQGEEPA